MSAGVVSVIIPTFNAEGFVRRAIRSALAQDGLGELILVDDCSTDGTIAVLEVEAASDQRVRIVRLSTNLGPSGARNAGLEAARYDWIAMLDADDAFVSDRLTRLVSFARETGADVVADDLAYYDAQANRVTGRGLRADEVIPSRDLTLRDFLAHNLADGRDIDWGLLKPVIRRSLLVKTGLRYDRTIRHGEDFRFAVDLLLAGFRFRIFPEPFYLYTQRRGAVSGRASGMTRTAIAYDRLRDAALVMAEQPGIRDDAALVGLLRARARGLVRLDHAAFLSAAIRHGALMKIGSRCVRYPEFLPLMIRQLISAARRRIGRR